MCVERSLGLVPKVGFGAGRGDCSEPGNRISDGRPLVDFPHGLEPTHMGTSGLSPTLGAIDGEPLHGSDFQYHPARSVHDGRAKKRSPGVLGPPRRTGNEQGRDPVGTRGIGLRPGVRRNPHVVLRRILTVGGTVGPYWV